MGGIADITSEAAFVPGAENQDDWIGRPPSVAEIIAYLIVGSVGLIIAGVQPVILGALVGEHRLSASGLGWTATVEFLTLGAGVSLAGLCLGTTALRAKAAIITVLSLVADLAAHGQSGSLILLDRAVAGLFEGAMVWVTMLMITRSPTPGRWAAIFLVAQGVLQLGFAATVPAAIMQAYGADGAFVALAATCAMALCVTWLLPRTVEPLKAPDPVHARKRRMPAQAWASLLGVALIYAFFIGVFAYLEQLGAQAKLTEAQTGYAVAIAVGVSILGSGAAAVLARRISYFVAFLLCLPVNVIALIVFAGLPAPATFLTASAAFGFFWGFFMPFQMPFVIEADPSREASMHVPATQALGCAAGPLLCSFVVTDSDARGALVICAICFALAFAIAAILYLLHRTRRGAVPEVT